MDFVHGTACDLHEPTGIDPLGTFSPFSRAVGAGFYCKGYFVGVLEIVGREIALPVGVRVDQSTELISLDLDLVLPAWGNTQLFETSANAIYQIKLTHVESLTSVVLHQTHPELGNIICSLRFRWKLWLPAQPYLFRDPLHEQYSKQLTSRASRERCA